MNEEFLTVAEVAERLKMNQQTIRNWIDRGELPAIRLGPRRVRAHRQRDLLVEPWSAAAVAAGGVVRRSFSTRVLDAL
jgi:excisionase family DNA binding protein